MVTDSFLFEGDPFDTFDPEIGNMDDPTSSFPMDDPDPVFISESELVHADDIFGVVILDIHQVAGSPFGIFRELAANLNIDFFSASLADKIDFEAKKIGKIQRVLLQVNSGRDPAKFGAEIEEAEPLLEAVLSKQNIAVEGLMAIAPLDEDPDSARRAFDTLRTMRDDFQARFGVSLPELSMGMTSDLECAIEAGSTMIRVGTFLYGQRFYPEK